MIFANILLGPLLRLAVPLRRLAAPGARIVLSGLLPGHANAVLAIYRAQGFVLERRIPLDGWVTLVMRIAQKKPPRAGMTGAASPVKSDAYQPPNGIFSAPVLTSRLPRSVSEIGRQQMAIARDFAARLLHARLDERIQDARKPALAPRLRAPAWRQARQRERGQRHK